MLHNKAFVYFCTASEKRTKNLKGQHLDWCMKRKKILHLILIVFIFRHIFTHKCMCVYVKNVQDLEKAHEFCAYALSYYDNKI